MKTKNKILLAGPWIGEFGYELFCWQGHIRRLSKDYGKTIVIGRPGHNILYSDFVDEYIEFDPDSYLTNGWRCEGSKPYKDLVSSIEHTNYIDGQFDIGMNYTGDILNDRQGLFFNQVYNKYESNTEIESYDILFHGRNKKSGDVRNWDRDNWVKLSKSLEGCKIASIGNDESFHIEGTDDLRGVSLNDLVGVMNKSKLIVGPSSGPMHLASLCGLKHLVWSEEFNRLRYEKYWNPFGTEVIFHTGGDWNPKVEDIKNIINEEI